MKIHIITAETGPNFNAGQKAPADIVKIISNNYYSNPIWISNFNTNEFLKSHNIFYRVIRRTEFLAGFKKSRKKNNIVVIQYPMLERTNFLHKLYMFNMKFLNKKRSVILLHDVDGIRYKNEKYLKQDIERFNAVNYIIAHNDVMKKELIRLGVESKELIDEATKQI